MRRLHPSWPLVTAGAAGLAVAAESSAHYAGDRIPLRVADGVVGFVILLAAFAAWRRRPDNRVGALMAVAGIAWFAGGFWPGLAHLHRGSLVQLHVSYPTARLRWWPAAVIVGAVYGASLVGRLARNDALTIALSAIVAVVATGQFVRTSGTARRAGLPALFAAWTFAGVLGLAAYGRHAGWQADTQLLWLYYVAVVVAVTVLLVDFLRARWSQAVVTELVIDLGRRRGTGTVRGALARALGDPSLEFAFWLDDAGCYVDDVGQSVDVTVPGPGRVATTVSRRGAPLAMMVHDAAMLSDPNLVDAVAVSAAIAVSNVRLQAEARRRVEALVASRRRIVEAGDAQRQRFGVELEIAVQRRLAAVAETIESLRGCPDLPTELVAELTRDLDATRSELDDIASGLHGALTEGGLAVAIHELSGRFDFGVDVTVNVGRLPALVEATVFYVCAEALANAAKHAAADHVRVEVNESAGNVTTTVADDGLGGTDLTLGTGLRGLVDRVEAIGGGLTIESRPGAGTTLRATIPNQL